MNGDALFLGVDCGATTSKVGGVDVRGEVLSLALQQSPTGSENGPAHIVQGWVAGLERFLADIGRTWADVAAVGLAIPGPYLGPGILGRMPNMPAALEGWHFLDDLGAAIRHQSGRAIPVATANDGLLAGLAEAQRIQQEQPGSVLMFAPGSGLGCSYVGADGRLLHGDHQAAVIFCHMPAPYALVGLPRFRCGCGRDWGCYEAYTSLSGLPQMLEHCLPDFPGHDLFSDSRPVKERALSLRELAQSDDPLALRIFGLQARMLGLAVAAGCMAYDPTHIVIGGGLMDPQSTLPKFREQYIDTVRKSASAYLWIDAQELTYRQAHLGELSQAVGGGGDGGGSVLGELSGDT